jgi:GTP cyclohydrolase II
MSLLKPQANRDQLEYCAFFNESKHKEFNFLSNFYLHPVISKTHGQFACSEGLYQFLKFAHLNDAALKTTFQQAIGQRAFDLSREMKEQVDPHWDRVAAMRYTLQCKFSDIDLKKRLLETHQAYLVENSPNGHDAFWADNGNGSGQNYLGTLLMELRQALGGHGIVSRPAILELFYSRHCEHCDNCPHFTNQGMFYHYCDDHMSYKSRSAPCVKNGRYRLYSAATIPTSNGLATLAVFHDRIENEENDVIVFYPPHTFQHGKENIAVRVHDACATSELFDSTKCDCKLQLDKAKTYVAQHGGIIIYLKQEGRGIGLGNKMLAYQLQQEQGLDTVMANRALGFPDDARQYDAVRDILNTLGVKSIQLISNNPRKKACLEALGVKVTGYIECQVEPQSTSMRDYMNTKAHQMGHLITL